MCSGHSFRVATSVQLVAALMSVLGMQLLVVLPCSHHMVLLLSIMVHTRCTHLLHTVLLNCVQIAILSLLIGVELALLKLLHFLSFLIINDIVLL